MDRLRCNLEDGDGGVLRHGIRMFLLLLLLGCWRRRIGVCTAQGNLGLTCLLACLLASLLPLRHSNRGAADWLMAGRGSVSAHWLRLSLGLAQPLALVARSRNTVAPETPSDGQVSLESQPRVHASGCCRKRGKTAAFLYEEGKSSPSASATFLFEAFLFPLPTQNHPFPHTYLFPQQTSGEAHANTLCEPWLCFTVA